MNHDKAESPEKWAQAAVKMTGEVDKVIADAPAAASPLPKERYTSIKRLSDAIGMTFFSLGPVYFTANVTHDILAEFAQLHRIRPPEMTVRFKIKVFNGLGAWDHLLQAIPDELMPLLDAHLATQIGRCSGDGSYWRFRPYNMLIPDPVAIEERTLRVGEPDYRLKIYLPTGNKYQLMVPGRIAALPITPFRLDPDPVIVREASATLQRGASDEEVARFLRDNPAVTLPKWAPKPA